jgi:hypothetical protein
MSRGKKLTKMNYVIFCFQPPQEVLSMDQRVRFNVATRLSHIGVALGITGVIVFLLLFTFHSFLSMGWSYSVFGVGLSALLAAVVCLRDASDHFARVSRGQ